MLFNNCGLTGEQLCVILDGAAKMRDFKALTYKQNQLNLEAIQKLTPLLNKVAPNHLEEISLIDCKMTPTMIEQMMELLLESSRVNKLCLVNASHTERSFDKLVEFVEKSPYLKYLDLSW